MICHLVTVLDNIPATAHHEAGLQENQAIVSTLILTILVIFVYLSSLV